jgi:hypothetical protein
MTHDNASMHLRNNIKVENSSAIYIFVSSRQTGILSGASLKFGKVKDEISIRLIS